MKRLNIDLILIKYFQNITIPQSFFQAEIMRIYSFHSFLNYIREKFNKIMNTDDGLSILEKKTAF